MEKCIVCGLCAKDCVSRYIKIVDNKAETVNGFCIECGHCYAVCPTGAITLDSYSETELSETEDTNTAPSVSPEALLHLMKSRRSVRCFQNRSVEPEKMQMLLNTVKYAPTGRNTQQTRVTVVKEQLPELTHMAINTLASYADELPDNASDELKNIMAYYKEGFKGMKRSLDNKGKDLLFYHCDTLMVISAPNDVDGAIAASYVELLASALGLGCVYIGFMKLAAENEAVRRFLKIKRTHNIVCTLAIGYPEVKYLHTVPRKTKKTTVI